MSEQLSRDELVTFTSLEVLNQRLKTIVEDKTLDEPVRVRGMATDVNRTQSGHLHMRLRQGGHGLSCVVFRTMARELSFWIEDGQMLLVQGEIKVDAVWGEPQIVARHVELEMVEADVGRSEAIESAGWLDRARKRPLPRSPKVVGLVAGEQSKARTDVIGSLKDADIQARVAFEATSMQGTEVVDGIKSALAVLNADSDVDVIVIARGGGSESELAAFDDRTLAQAIVESRVPVVTAIGHRQDESLADLAAGRSVPTPSMVGAALAGRPAMRWDVIVAAVLAGVIALLLLAWAIGWW